MVCNSLRKKRKGKAIYAGVTESVVSGFVVIVTCAAYGEIFPRSCLIVDNVT